MHFQSNRSSSTSRSATPVSRDPSPEIGNFMEVDYIDNFLGASSEMEDDPPPKASKYNYPYVKEDYNGAGRAFGTGLTFMDQLKQDQFEPQRAENLYYPFASKDEWELSLFLLRSDMSVGMLNDFLKLELIKKLNLSYKSAKDLRNRAEILPSGPQWKSQTIIPEIPSKNQLTLFYRDGLECIKALLISPLLQDSMHFSPFKLFDKCNEMMRVYTEWFSGDIAHFMQVPKDQLPKGATLVPPIISTDKTNISNMTGGRVAYPGLISIANIMMNVRNKSSNHLFLLFVLLPIPKFLHRSKAVNGMMAARLYHQCMDIALESVKQTARVGTTMADALGNNRFCFTPLAALIVDTPESALAACVAGSTSSVTLAQYETFGDSFRHPSRTADHTINTIMAINNVKPPNHLEPYLKESKKHRLNGVHLPFWRDWPLSDPSAFLTPEPLHHWHKMFWDHDAKWCIAAVGGSELDFRFSILQHRTGFRHFKEGISSLKQVTGREHRDVQRYIVALIADTVSTPFILAIRSLMDFRYLAQSQTISEAMCLRIEQALQDFHANKQAILDAGARRGKKNNPIDNFYIPKLEFLQSVVHAIRLNGCAIQWSADTTEHAHIEVVKAPSSSSNNQRYEPQVCRYLDRRDKLRNFDLFTAIREMRIDFRAIHSATITDEEEQEEGDEGEENGEVVMDTTSELLSTIMPMTTFQSAKSNRIVDYFYKASLYERGVLEGPVPYRTFSCSKNVVAHLSRDASSKRLHIDEVASIFKIPDLRPAIADYVSLINKESNPRQTNSRGYHIKGITGRRVSPPGCPLPYSKLEVWHKVRIQSTAYQYPHEILEAVTLNAYPPSNKHPFGYFDSAIINVDESEEWPRSGLQGHSVVDIRIIFRIVGETPSTVSPDITGRFLAYVQRFEVLNQPQSLGSAIRGPYPEPITGMYKLKRSQRTDNTIMGGILPLNQIRSLVDLVPQMGEKARRSLTTHNSHSTSTEFRLNKYFDKELYLALSS
uniref:DUF6830 domain-containing protein n=1 Tax=Psilocybe cubensis TaxID=181762 RepID=A0A8H7XQ13_PSICU